MAEPIDTVRPPVSPLPQARLTMRDTSSDVDLPPAPMLHSTDTATDIEELITTSTPVSSDRSVPSLVTNIVRRRRRRTAQPAFSASSTQESTGVPGVGKIWCKTFGCSHNVSDGEYMAGMLDSYGYEIVDDQASADLWLVTSCTVKGPSEDSCMKLVRQAKQQGRAIVVGGCVPQGDRTMPGLDGVSLIGVQQIDRVVEVVEETLKGHTVRLLAKSSLPRLDLPKIRANPRVEIVPLSTGCLGSCTYCKTVHARGKLGSYAVEAIVSRVALAVADGVTEVWMSSEDTGAYGIDLGTTFPALLRAVVPVLPPDVMLRVGMTNPPYILEHLDAVAHFLNHPSVFSFLHVPVQAGSNAVLDAMNREYTVEDFRTVVDHLRANVPDVTISTDIICGFPSESDADFEATMQLAAEYQFHIMHITQFYPRPGTPAASMPQLPSAVKKDRSRRLAELLRSMDPYAKLVGTRHKVWVNTEASGEHTVAHTKNYTKVLLPRDPGLEATTCEVVITGSSRWHVTGEVVTTPTSILSAATTGVSGDAVHDVTIVSGPSTGSMGGGGGGGGGGGTATTASESSSLEWLFVALVLCGVLGLVLKAL